MSKTNKIAELLIEAGCDPENIKGLVKRLCKATKGKGRLQIGIAVAIYLKFIAQQLCDDNDEQTNLEVLLDLANAYDVSNRRKQN